MFSAAAAATTRVAFAPSQAIGDSSVPPRRAPAAEPGALFRFSNVNFCDHDAIARFAMAVACLSDRVAK